jgi:hypothetical protein
MFLTEKSEIEDALDRWHGAGHPGPRVNPGQYQALTVGNLIDQLSELPAGLPIHFGTEFFPTASRVVVIETSAYWFAAITT